MALKIFISVIPYLSFFPGKKNMKSCLWPTVYFNIPGLQKQQLFFLRKEILSVFVFFGMKLRDQIHLLPFSGTTLHSSPFKQQWAGE